MAYLNWIIDEDLQKIVLKLITKSEKVKKEMEKDFHKNVIDPFSALFNTSTFQLSYDKWEKGERRRQEGKKMEYEIGVFHQRVLGAVDGWKDLGRTRGVDVKNKQRKIIAEIKNKHNTVKKSDLVHLYNLLHDQVKNKGMEYKGYTAYYVPIIPANKLRYKKLFTPSISKTGEKCGEDERIIEMDGASFYELVTGDKKALANLFQALPTVIMDVSKGKYTVKEIEKVQELFEKAFE